jgi:hypothetical protein
MSTQQYTTTEVARMTGKTSARICQIAIAEQIGVCYNHYMRLFSPADVRKFQRIFAKSGRRSKNAINAIDSLKRDK